MKLIDTEAHKKEIRDALADGGTMRLLRAFFFPKMVRAFFLRLLLVIAAVYLLCRFIFLPVWIKGGSMLPTYGERGFNFCFTPAYRFRSPGRGDIVIMRQGTDRVMLLKRVVALGGDTVAFRRGVLFVNGFPVRENYIKGPCDWELPERKVEPDHYYIVGDNRSVPMEAHRFGSVHKRYLKGAPLW